MSTDNKKNYYEILKISPLASPFTIKKSYQKLARIYHPDKNPNNPDAAETFKQINEAYQILSDTFKRKDFDRQREQEKQKEEQKKQKEAFSPLYESYHSYSPFGSPSTRPPSPSHPKKETSFTQQPPFPEKRTTTTPSSSDKKEEGPFSIKGLKTYFTKTPTPHPDQIQGQLEISLEEAALGCKKTVSLNVTQKENFWVHIPPGTKEKQNIKIHNKNNKSKTDLYVSIAYKKHPLFTLEKENILMDLPIPFTKAILGGEVEIPTLGGRVSFQLPAGTHGGDVIQLKGQGFPTSSPHKKKRGHMLISVLIDIPIHFSEEEKKWIQNIQDRNQSCPKVADFSIKTKLLLKKRKNPHHFPEE
ncbi:MAG: J domain-containing protein [Oligoflexia bacterium]|nr:J domain-containing protein [Oligoflexia bacterium]